MLSLLRKILPSNISLIIAGLLVITTIGSGVYTLYLKHELRAYKQSTEVLAEVITNKERETKRLRQDIEDLDTLLSKRQEAYSTVREQSKAKQIEREELKREDPEARKYYSSRTPDSVLKRMQQW